MYSSSGEDVELSTADGDRFDGLGMDRRQVAFMGYWRRGVAMRS